MNASFLIMTETMGATFIIAQDLEKAKRFSNTRYRVLFILINWHYSYNKTNDKAYRERWIKLFGNSI